MSIEATGSSTIASTMLLDTTVDTSTAQTTEEEAEEAALVAGVPGSGIAALMDLFATRPSGSTVTADSVKGASDGTEWLANVNVPTLNWAVNDDEE